MPKKTIAVDFDGVIHGYSKGWNGGDLYDPPVPGTAEALSKLKKEGYTIYIYTTRTNKIYRKKEDPDQQPLIESYLKEHGIPFDKVWNFGKPMADVYLDDRAVGFRGNWNETLEEVLSFKTWIEEKENN